MIKYADYISCIIPVALEGHSDNVPEKLMMLNLSETKMFIKSRTTRPPPHRQERAGIILEGIQGYPTNWESDKTQTYPSLLI